MGKYSERGIFGIEKLKILIRKNISRRIFGSNGKWLIRSKINLS